MSQTTEEYLNSCFTQMRKLNLHKRSLASSEFLFFLGYLSKSHFNNLKSLTKLLDALALLPVLEEAGMVDFGAKKQKLADLLRDPSMKTEKIFDDLFVNRQEEIKEENTEENTGENPNEEEEIKPEITAKIHNLIAHLGNIKDQFSRSPLDAVFWGICAREHPNHEIQLLKQIKSIRTLRRNLESEQTLQLQAALFKNPKVNLRSCLKQKGITPNPHKSINKVSVQDKKAKLKEQECLICLTDFSETPNRHIIGLCRHVFHKECLSEYVKIKMADQSFPVICPYENCGIELAGADLNAIMNQEEVKKYYDLSISHYMNNKLTPAFQCPTPDCAFRLFEIKDTQKHVTCPLCKVTFCLACKEKEHAGTECRVNQFMQTARKLGYKMCLACFKWVEKNEGCDHMTCKCGNQFCYKCGGKYGKCDGKTCINDKYYKGMEGIIQIKGGDEDEGEEGEEEQKEHKEEAVQEQAKTEDDDQKEAE